MYGSRLSPAVPYNPGEWTYLHAASVQATNLTGTKTFVWRRGALQVLSSAETAEYRDIICPHNHVSVSVATSLTRHPTDAEVALVRADFDMDDAEEDNHQPGSVRNLFLPLHLPRGTTGVCDCKTNEEQVTEPDGFMWSRPRDWGG